MARFAPLRCCALHGSCRALLRATLLVVLGFCLALVGTLRLAHQRGHHDCAHLAASATGDPSHDEGAGVERASGERHHDGGPASGTPCDDADCGHACCASLPVLAPPATFFLPAVTRAVWQLELPPIGVGSRGSPRGIDHPPEAHPV